MGGRDVLPFEDIDRIGKAEGFQGHGRLSNGLELIGGGKGRSDTFNSTAVVGKKTFENDLFQKHECVTKSTGSLDF